VRAERQIQDRLWQIALKKEALGIKAIGRFVHVTVFDMNAIEEINDVLITNVGIESRIQHLARRRPEHRLIVIANDIREDAVRVRGKSLHRLENVAMAIQDRLKLLNRNTLGNNRKEVTTIIGLKEVEEVAVNNHFDFGIAKFTAAIVIEKLDELFAEVEFFERIRRATFKGTSAAEMQI